MKHPQEGMVSDNEINPYPYMMTNEGYAYHRDRVRARDAEVDHIAAKIRNQREEIARLQVEITRLRSRLAALEPDSGTSQQ